VVVEPVIQVEVADGIPGSAREHARRRTTDVIRRHPHPVSCARVRISRHPLQAPTPVLARVRLDVDDHPVRVQALGATAEEAVDRLEARLQARLESLSTVWADDLHAAPVTWGDHPADALDHEGNVLARHKMVVLETSSVDEAIAEMDYRGARFHLFSERGTGRDSVVSRDPGGHCHLQQIRPADLPVDEAGPRLEPFDLEVQVDDEAVPVFTMPQAVRALHAGDRGFLFFRDVRRGRGSVVYRRDDGAFGELIALN
jgi:Sigma 54 modulation/S30EA ribosomal protein C terminus